MGALIFDMCFDTIEITLVYMILIGQGPGLWFLTPHSLWTLSPAVQDNLSNEDVLKDKVSTLKAKENRVRSTVYIFTILAPSLGRNNYSFFYSLPCLVIF